MTRKKLTAEKVDSARSNAIKSTLSEEDRIFLDTLEERLLKACQYHLGERINFEQKCRNEITKHSILLKNLSDLIPMIDEMSQSFAGASKFLTNGGPALLIELQKASSNRKSILERQFRFKSPGGVRYLGDVALLIYSALQKTLHNRQLADAIGNLIEPNGALAQKINLEFGNASYELLKIPVPNFHVATGRWESGIKDGLREAAFQYVTYDEGRSEFLRSQGDVSSNFDEVVAQGGYSHFEIVTAAKSSFIRNELLHIVDDVLFPMPPPLHVHKSNKYSTLSL